MNLETFPVGPRQCNCTQKGDEEAHEAIVIDPGDDGSRIHWRLTELGRTLGQILVTNTHIDTVDGYLMLKKITGAPILLKEDDLPLFKLMQVQASWLGIETPKAEPLDETRAVAGHGPATTIDAECRSILFLRS